MYSRFLKDSWSYSEVGNAFIEFIPNWTYPLTRFSVTIYNISNRDLWPELTKSWEAGLVARLWMDKIRLNVSFYKTSTYNPGIQGSHVFGLGV